jgi:phage-related protein
MFTLIFGTYTFPNQTFEVTEFPLNRDVIETSVPRVHGTIIQTPYMKSRTIRIKGMLHSSVKADTEGQWQDMCSIACQGNQSFYSRTDRYLDCEVKFVRPSPVDGSDGKILEIEIEAVAADPFYYAAGASRAVVANAPGVTFFDVSNYGTAYSEPIISFVPGANFSDAVYLLNQRSGQAFSYSGPMVNGQTLVIDTKKLLVENGGVDGMSWMSGNFPMLVPGSNTFAFIGSTCSVRVEYKDRWY